MVKIFILFPITRTELICDIGKVKVRMEHKKSIDSRAAPVQSILYCKTVWRKQQLVAVFFMRLKKDSEKAFAYLD